MARVLVVDDENNIRVMVRRALEHSGHEVATAADGEEGLILYGDGSSCDVVVLDQRMPGMEGLDALREMRRRNPDAKIIMATAFGTIDLAVDAMKSGATDFLRKPFTADMLRGAIQSAIHQDRPTHGDAGVTFASTTINGFRIEFEVNTWEQAGSCFRQLFTVRSPDGHTSECAVVLPSYTVELVKAHTDREELPGEERFWQALCEEALANHLWQNAEAPSNGELRVEELTAGLKRFVDAVLAA